MPESIGTIYQTQIPAYEDAADIQAALKLYHYGTTDPITVGELEPTGDIVPNSVAGHLKAIDVRLQVAENSGVGSTYASAMPTDVPDGFIWMDSDDTLGTTPGLVAAYQTTAPSNPTLGSLWVDSTSESALSLKVYNGTTWKVIV